MAHNVLATCEPARDSQGRLPRALSAGLRLCPSAARLTGAAASGRVTCCGSFKIGGTHQGDDITLSAFAFLIDHPRVPIHFNCFLMTSCCSVS